MEKSEEIKLRKQLHSNEPIDIIKAVSILRETGNEIFIEDLARILCTTDNNEIYALTLRIFDDLKNKNAVPEIIKVIKDKSYEKEKRSLVSSCWKSGLDYSAALSIFFDIFINDDFLTAFEAYSVLETNIPNLKPAVAKKHLDFLLKKEKDISSDRIKLLAILKNMLLD